MTSFFTNVSAWVKNSLARVSCCLSARSSKAQKLERRSAHGGKLEIVIVPIPMDYSEFCRRIRAMEEEDERKLKEAKKLKEAQEQAALKLANFSKNIDIIPSAEDEQATTIVEPYHHMENDDCEDKLTESIAQVMLKLQQCYDEQEYLYNLSIGISPPRPSTYSAESGCLPPSEYYGA